MGLVTLRSPTWHDPPPASVGDPFLPELQQSTLLLRVIGDLSVAETATTLGVSQSAVKSAQYRAALAIRDRLESDATKPASPSVTDVT